MEGAHLFKHYYVLFILSLIYILRLYFNITHMLVYDEETNILCNIESTSPHKVVDFKFFLLLWGFD